MKPAECSYDGCHNNRASNPPGLCKPHRRVQLQEGSLRPLRPRFRLQSPTCTGPECSRKSEAHDLCKQHGQQLRERGELHVIGDSTYKSRKSRERWAAMPEEQKAQWVAAMQVGRRSLVWTEAHSQARSVSTRAAWQRKAQATDPTSERDCLTCGKPFTRTVTPGGRQFYCSPECRNLYAKLRRHGLTHQQYDAMLTMQGGVCAICRSAWKGWNGKQGPHIDHCHDTGRVRGLLCGDCNTALGRFSDDPVLLRRAADYLEV